MGVTRKVWIEYRDTREIALNDPVAIVGSPGLRSVGKLVVDVLVESLQPTLFAELFSYGFPCIYYGPSYLEAPSHAGALIEKGYVTKLPNVAIYVLKNESPEEEANGRDIVIIKGYQAYDAYNHYMVADKLTDLFTELNITRVISLGAQVIEEGIRCCVTDVGLLEEMSRYGIGTTQVDRFIGFSGLVTAVGREKGIEGVCLFASTVQSSTDPEYPDFSAAKELLEKVGEIVKLEVDTTDLEAKRRKDDEQLEAGMEREREEERAEQREREREELSGYV
ncbi:MAG TPA: PAC2 family protein [Desulfobacteria bacterium]|nr:PAC2 family protein [Desulfobacteria bacterium]